MCGMTEFNGKRNEEIGHYGQTLTIPTFRYFINQLIRLSLRSKENLKTKITNDFSRP